MYVTLTEVQASSIVKIFRNVFNNTNNSHEEWEKNFEISSRLQKSITVND